MRTSSGGTVIFLGAGASKPMGLPLTRDILPRMLTGIEEKTLFRDDTDAREQLDCMLKATVFPGLDSWLRCDLCDHVYMNPNGPIAYLAFNPKCPAADGPPDLASTCHCGFYPLRHIMIAPSTVRDIRDPTLLEIWKAALEALRAADDWLIIGYSLPSEDVAIRSMFLRAWHARRFSSKPLIRVIQSPPVQSTGNDGQPATMSRTETNYRLAFGPVSYEAIGVEKLIRPT